MLTNIIEKAFFILGLFSFSALTAATEPLSEISALMQDGKSDEALQMIEKICETSPNELTCGEALLLMSQIHFSKMEMDKGLSLYDQVIQIGKHLNNNSLLERAYGGKGEVLFIRGEYEKSLPVIRECLMVIRADDQKSYSNALTQIGNCYRFLGDLDSSKIYIERARQIKFEINDQRGLPFVLVSLAAVSTRKGYVEEAISLNLEAINILEKLQDSIQLAQLYFATANLFNGQGDYIRAYEYADRALIIATALNLKSTKANALLSRARPNAKLGNENQALLDLKLALSIYEQRKVGLYIGDCLHELGWIYLNRAQYDSARYYFDRMIDVAYTRKDKDHLFSANFNLGQLALKENKPNDALQYFHEANNHFTKENFKSRAQLEQGLFEAYNLKGNTAEALVHLSRHTQFKDSSYSLEKTKLFYDLEAKYNRTVQEKEITALAAENRLSKVQLSNSRRWLYTLLAGIVGIGLLLARIFQSNRKIKEQNQIISNALEEKDTLLKEIHHRVKNNLQFISSLLSLQSDHIENDQALEALKEGQDRVQSMALIHQNLYQDDNLTGIDIRAYFEKLTQNLFDSYNISPEKIKLKMDIQPLNLDVDTVVPLGLIINELVSNALKHAFKGRNEGIISVEIKENGTELSLAVRDDGIGLENGQLDTSFGYRLINAFKTQLNAELEVNGHQGTHIRMTIKEYQKSA